jgi:hypothetical protein
MRIGESEASRMALCREGWSGISQHSMAAAHILGKRGRAVGAAGQEGASAGSSNLTVEPVPGMVAASAVLRSSAFDGVVKAAPMAPLFHLWTKGWPERRLACRAVADPARAVRRFRLDSLPAAFPTKQHGRDRDIQEHRLPHGASGSPPRPCAGRRPARAPPPAFAQSAATSSDLNDPSDSTAALDDNAAMASAEPTRPRAQAACARTNGSGSESAKVSTGTASGAPQLPSPTQTLHASGPGPPGGSPSPWRTRPRRPHPALPPAAR